ncbi:MAG: ribosome recycling factor [Acholeplasmataceae bacterium]|jgi:ribosome recycling factor|nr:ribosome recycling factor [Acholeplasmataceae bacterium]
MSEQTDLILMELEEKMEKSVEAIVAEFQNIRTGRANPGILDSIFIKYYGVDTQLKQISSITVPEGNQLYIKPFDKSILKEVERAIGTSKIGLTPQNDGIGLRLIFPQLTEERRKELSKDVTKLSENGKVAIRNIRRDGNEQIKKLSLPEDLEFSTLDEIQKLTDKYTEKMDEVSEKKIEEIMNI